MTAQLDVSTTRAVPFSRLVGVELRKARDFTGIAAYMTSFLLPILTIMLVTSEWSQRTALVTFTLEPRRSRVVLAKLVVAQLFTVITLVLAPGGDRGVLGLQVRPARHLRAADLACGGQVT